MTVVGEEDDVADDGDGGGDSGEKGSAIRNALIEICDEHGENGSEGVGGHGEELGLGGAVAEGFDDRWLCRVHLLVLL